MVLTPRALRHTFADRLLPDNNFERLSWNDSFALSSLDAQHPIFHRLRVQVRDWGSATCRQSQFFTLSYLVQKQNGMEMQSESTRERGRHLVHVIKAPYQHKTVLCINSDVKRTCLHLRASPNPQTSRRHLAAPFGCKHRQPKNSHDPRTISGRGKRGSYEGSQSSMVSGPRSATSQLSRAIND